MGEKGAGRAGGAKEAEREVEQEQQRGRHRETIIRTGTGRQIRRERICRRKEERLTGWGGYSRRSEKEKKAASENRRREIGRRIRDLAGPIAVLTLAGALAGCAGYEEYLSVGRTAGARTAQAIPEQYGLTEEEIRNARNTYTGYAACLKREKEAADAMKSPLMQLDPKSCPRIILEFRLDTDRQDLVSSYATQSLGADEYGELAKILEQGGALDAEDPDLAEEGPLDTREILAIQKSSGKGGMETAAIFPARETEEVYGDDSGQEEDIDRGFAKGDGSEERGDAYRYGEDRNTPERRTLTPTLRYVYELVTFSGSDARSSRRVIQGTEESHAAERDSEESYEPWEDEEREPGETKDPWENFTMQSAKTCDGTQTELEEREEEAGAGPMSAAFGNTDSVGTGTGIPVSGNEVPWIVDPYGTGILTPQEERSAAEENPVTSIEDRYLARMYVEIRSFSIPLCEEMEEVVMRAILHHTADLLSSGDDLTAELVSRKVTSSADPTLAQLQRRRCDFWQEAVEERKDYYDRKVQILDRKEQKLFAALCREDPKLQEDSETADPASIPDGHDDRDPGKNSEEDRENGNIPLPGSGICVAAERTALTGITPRAAGLKETVPEATDLAKTPLVDGNLGKTKQMATDLEEIDLGRTELGRMVLGENVLEKKDQGTTEERTPDPEETEQGEKKAAKAWHSTHPHRRSDTGTISGTISDSRSSKVTMLCLLEGNKEKEGKRGRTGIDRKIGKVGKDAKIAPAPVSAAGKALSCAGSSGSGTGSKGSVPTAAGAGSGAVSKAQSLPLLPLPQLFWWTGYQLQRKLTPMRLLWMLLGGLAMLFLCPLVIVLEVSSREAFWCAEELRHFTDLPVAGPLFADAPQGQLKRALESTEKEILRLAKERGVRNLYVLLGEEDMEHIGKKEVLSARETNLIRCLDGRLQKSGIRLAYGNPEKFRKDQEELETCDAILSVCRQGISGGGDLREKAILAGSRRKQILAILMLSAPPLSGKEKRREKKRMKRKRAKKRKRDLRRRQLERERKTAAMEQKRAERPNPTAAEGREEKAGNRAEKEEGRG